MLDMRKMNTNKTKKGNRSQDRDWVRMLSLGIIALCVIILLALLGTMAWKASIDNPKVFRVVVTTDKLPDSLKACNYIDYAQTDSLISAVRRYDEQLTQKYQYLVEQKEQDSQMFYWGSLIVGIVIAVFGWFGFQSFTTIEDKAKNKASSVAANVAKRTAWNETNDFLNQEGKKQINEAAKENLQADVVIKVKEQVMDELNTIIENRLDQYLASSKIDDLAQRIESLEKSVIPEIDKAVREAVKEVFFKYKRPVDGGTKNKEEKK